jgi:hypothetical protein
MLSPLPGDQRIAVAAGIGIARRDARQRAAGGAANGAESAVFGQQAFHAVEHRFVQRDVDELAAAAALAFVQRQQDADDAVQRRQRVADADADAHRRRPGSPLR